ncbi:MAG: alpha-L-glutamate ligase-like protein [Spirulina sp.]
MWGVIRELKKAGVVGINARNAGYIMPLNPRKFYPLVDDKRKTKELAINADLAAPELYAVVESQGQIKNFQKMLGGRETFVIKPARGSQGDGITVIDQRASDGWRKVGGSVIKDSNLAFYLSNILSGMYSLAGQPDVALVEYRVNFDPVFERITYKGVPDVRVVVYRGVPAMAMLRLPTKESDGKANLHKGGIGAGVDIKTGKTTTAVQHDRVVEVHPDTKLPVSDLQIPGWAQILYISARSAELSHLGYLGVDIVLDKNLGPLILELNARPGLAIQIANRMGLATRFQQIDAALPSLNTLEEKLAFVEGLQS